MATMTRKEFVLQVTEALQKNPRAILAGHGIPAAVLKLIATRPDVIAKLAVILWSTKYFKKGAKGLKKSMNFKISGYKNFQDFNKRARTDVENFMAGLAPDDQPKFNNNESILTLIMLPDNASGEENTDIAFGKSVAIGFDKAVKKEYKIPGGIYVTIMYGDSAIRIVEEKKAAVKSKINARKQAKRTPAKVKMELTRKAKAKLEKLKMENEKLQGKRKKNELELEQINSFAGHLGVKAKTERDLIGGIKGYSGEMRALVGKLSGPKKLLFKKAVTLVRSGDKAGAEELLNKIGVKRITDLVLNRQGMTQISKVQEARIKAMRKEIKVLSRANEKLLVDISLAPTTSLKSSIRQKMKRQIARINELKAKLKVYEKSFTISGVRNKAKMIAETNKRIDANLAKGQSITISLANAIAALDASDSEKQEIKDAIMNEVAEGTPMQFAVQSAVQQAIQEAPGQLVMDDELLDGIAQDIVDDITGDISLEYDSAVYDSAEEYLNAIGIQGIIQKKIGLTHINYDTVFDMLIPHISAEERPLGGMPTVEIHEGVDVDEYSSLVIEELMSGEELSDYIPGSDIEEFIYSLNMSDIIVRMLTENNISVESNGGEIVNDIFNSVFAKIENQLTDETPEYSSSFDQYVAEIPELADVLAEISGDTEVDKNDTEALEDLIYNVLESNGLNETTFSDGIELSDFVYDYFGIPEDTTGGEEIESIGDTTQLDQYVAEVPELADVLAEISGDTDFNLEDIEALEDLIYNVLESNGLNETTFSDGIELSDFVYDYFGIPEDATGGEDITGEINLNADGTPTNGFERDNLDLAGNAFNDYIIDHEPEDRPSENVIMSYFTSVCYVAKVEAGDMPEVYDVYRDNVEKYMATSVGAPSSQDNFGGEADFDTSMVGNSTIDDILSML